MLPDDVAMRKVDILSEGTRMGGELYSLKSVAGKKLPTIVMSHGWGGTVGGLRRDAAAFAQTGYLVIAFDYRGWGASDSRVILSGRATAPVANRDETHRYSAEVQEVREVVDPMDMGADILN